jgi:predicted SnoaL-like aldol condensation-catalyzing enzyme
MFTQSDMRGAYERHAAADFKQHNPSMADGLAGHRAYFESLAHGQHGDTREWANVNDIILVDGDLFALLHHVFRSPQDAGRLFLDIWRVAGGRIVEHWDVVQAIPGVMAHANGIACPEAADYASARRLGDTIARPTCGLPDPAASREDSLAVIDSYSRQLRAGEVEGAIRRWFSSSYRQHSPGIADGIEGALAYLRGEFGEGPQAMPAFGPVRVIAEGEYVLLHRLVTYSNPRRSSANVDVFRVTGGRIAEHWDVKQPVPEAARNTNGMW